MFDDIKSMVNDEIIDHFKKGSFQEKLRIIRFIACAMIIFTWVCNSFWNLLSLINLQDVPPINDDVSNWLFSTGKCALIIYLVLYIIIFRIICTLISNEAIRKILLAIDRVLDIAFTMYFLLYAMNILLKFAQGNTMKIGMQTFIAFAYIAFWIGDTIYENVNTAFEDVNIRYTNFTDKDGAKIPENAKLSYRGKVYNVVKYDGTYKIHPQGREISDEDIALEEAASDPKGNLKLLQ